MGVLKRFAVFALFTLVLAIPAEALARRSGGSFSGRRFGSFPARTAPRPATTPGGPGVVVFPGFGWGLGGYGFGGMSSMLVLAALGVGAFFMMRQVARAQQRGHRPFTGYDEDAAPDRAYLHSVQLAFGRSGRSVQKSLARFAEEGDTGTETGLARLLQQTSVELLREKDSIRYAHVDGSGPHSLAQGEMKLNGIALKERARFQVERVRNAEGKLSKSEVRLPESPDVLEYIVVTLVVATRAPVDLPRSAERDQVEAALSALGSVPPRALLGLEVIWTPADEDDALTETDLLTSYPDLRGV